MTLCIDEHFLRIGLLATKFRYFLVICGSLFISSSSLCFPWRVNFQLPRTADGQVAGAHDPREWGYKAKCQHATSIPGYWPDESRQHGTSLNSLFFVNVSFIVLLSPQVFCWSTIESTRTWRRCAPAKTGKRKTSHSSSKKEILQGRPYIFYPEPEV